MSTFRIEKTSDECYCETCGTSYADGFNVYQDDKLIIELIPHADCYGGTFHQERDVLKEILTYLGHKLDERV